MPHTAALVPRRLRPAPPPPRTRRIETILLRVPRPRRLSRTVTPPRRSLRGPALAAGALAGASVVGGAGWRRRRARAEMPAGPVTAPEPVAPPSADGLAPEPPHDAYFKHPPLPDQSA